MNTLLLTHPASLTHDNGPGHPERADRVLVIERILEHEKFTTLIRAQAENGTREQALRVHPESYILALEQTSPRDGLARLDSDTTMSPGTLAAAFARSAAPARPWTK